MKRAARSVVVTALALVAPLFAAVHPQPEKPAGDEAARILSLENAWNEAESRHDVRALGLLLADSFSSTDIDGSFLNKSQWLAQIKSGARQYDQLSNSGMAVQLYGSAAVVTGEYHEKLKLNGKQMVRYGRFTDVWILQNGEWKCAATQSTLTGH